MTVCFLDVLIVEEVAISVRTQNKLLCALDNHEVRSKTRVRRPISGETA